MKCPHCLHMVTPDEEIFTISSGDDAGNQYAVSIWTCPNEECEETVIYYRFGVAQYFAGSGRIARFADSHPPRLIEPQIGSRPIPPEVPPDLAEDYNEASLVLHLSPKASAALSRRCLQNCIREAKGIKKGSLEREIDEVIAQRLVSSGLAEQLDAVRNIGNFAAHPIKSTSTGDVVEVEPGEAEWNLDVLDGLFEEWYVQPAVLAARKAKLNAKLTDANKPTI